MKDWMRRLKGLNRAANTRVETTTASWVAPYCVRVVSEWSQEDVDYASSMSRCLQ